MAGIFFGVIFLVFVLLVVFIIAAALIPDAIDDWLDVLDKIEERKKKEDDKS